MVTGWVIAGKAEPSSMVCTPVPPIAKSIAFGPVVLSDWVMAHRRVPVAVVSAVLVTVKVDSISRPSSGSTMNRRRRSGRRRGELTLRRLGNQGFTIGRHPSERSGRWAGPAG